jgi:hypothetical protein
MARRPKPSARPAIALKVESTSPYGCILRFTTKIPRSRDLFLFEIEEDDFLFVIFIRKHWTNLKIYYYTLYFLN